MTRATSQLRRLELGTGCALVVGSVSWMIAGQTAAIAAGTLALVATGMQLAAAAVTDRLGGTGSPDRLGAYGTGMLLRSGGVVVLGALVAVDRAGFPPGPSAAGYLATVLLLLYLETRLGR